MTEQIALPLSTQVPYRFDDFLLTRSTRLAVDELNKFTHRNSESVIFLSGESGTGKSHLLHATCHALTEMGELPVYLSLSQPYLIPAALDNLEHHRFVCIDHLDYILGQEQWEECLFHFYNRSQEEKSRLLIAASQAPMHLPFCLPDLQSRLSHGLSIPLSPLTDAEKIYVLQQNARMKGMELSMDASSYMIRHVSEDMATLIDSLTTLDEAALVKKRRLTIPFIRSTLQTT